MEENNREAVREIIDQVMEQTVFAFTESAELAELADEAVEDAVQSRISFDGDWGKGSLAIAAPVSYCGELAANFLGLDPGDPEALADSKDTLNEILNIICGQLLTKLAGTEPIFNLSIPENAQLDSAGWRGLCQNEDAIALKADDNPLLLHFTLERKTDNG